MRVMSLLVAALSEVYKDDPTMPGLVTAWLPTDKKYYVAANRYKKEYGEGKEKLCAARDVTLETAVDAVARAWLKQGFCKRGDNILQQALNLEWGTSDLYLALQKQMQLDLPYAVKTELVVVHTLGEQVTVRTHCVEAGGGIYSVSLGTGSNLHQALLALSKSWLAQYSKRTAVDALKEHLG